LKNVIYPSAAQEVFYFIYRMTLAAEKTAAVVEINHY
jgi:hypothetical protein